MQKEEYTALVLTKELERQKLIEDFEERAAIMQFCGNVDPRHVNRLAYFDWRKNNPNVVVPEEIRDKVRLSEKKNGSNAD